jgi:hypothetical protein
MTAAQTIRKYLGIPRSPYQCCFNRVEKCRSVGDFLHFGRLPKITFEDYFLLILLQMLGYADSVFTSDRPHRGH